MSPFFLQLQGKIPRKIQYKFEFWFLCSYLENGVTRVPRASGILFFGARNIRIEILQPPCKYIFILCTTQLLTPLKGFGFFIHILKWWYIFFVRLCVQIFHVLVFRKLNSQFRSYGFF